MKSRIVFLDILKIIAILLVCSCHFLLYQNRAADNFIAVLACSGVPLFFMVNGALLFSRDFDMKKHWRRTGNLIIILLIWKIITPLAEYFALRDTVLPVSKTEILQYLLGGDLSGYYVGHFWFMHALIGIYILVPMLRKCYDDIIFRKYIYILLGILFFFTVLLNEVDTGLDILTRYFARNTASVSGLNEFNPFGGYGYCLFYFLLGAVLYDIIISKKKKIPVALSVVAIIGGWAWLFGLNRYQNSYTEAKWIVVNGYERIASILVSIGIFTLMYHIGERITNIKIKKCLKLMGDNTMGIYYLHVIIGTWFVLFYNQYVSQYGVLENIIKTIIFFGISLLISCIFRKIPIICRLFK